MWFPVHFPFFVRYPTHSWAVLMYSTRQGIKILMIHPEGSLKKASGEFSSAKILAHSKSTTIKIAGGRVIFSSSHYPFLNINVTPYLSPAFLSGLFSPPHPLVRLWPLPWLSRYLPQGDHVIGWQSVQPPAGAGVLQEQPQPLLPLQPGGHALCTCIHKGRSNGIYCRYQWKCTRLQNYSQRKLPRR